MLFFPFLFLFFFRNFKLGAWDQYNEWNKFEDEDIYKNSLVYYD